MFKPMKSKDYKREKIIFPVICEPKLDGDRGIYIDGNFYSSNNKKIWGLDHITQHLKKLNAPLLDGELFIPKRPQNESSGILRSNTIKKPAIWYNIFDAPEIELYYKDRLLYCSIYDDTDSHIILTQSVEVNSLLKLNNYYAQCLNDGYEGIMIKNPFHYYQQGKISWDWMKKKEIHSVDILIIDFVEGTGKYINMLGYLICLYENKKVRIGYGFKDKERKEFWENRNKMKGKIIEVRYQNKTKNGIFRHPRFFRLRPDKD